MDVAAEIPTHKARTRRRILDEAAKAMRENGSGGIGVSDLMKRAGLTHGGFYAHFSNRDDLVAHAIDRMFLDTATLLDRTIGQADVRAGLVSLIDAYLSEPILEKVDGSCPLPSLTGEAPRMPEKARQRFIDGIERFRTGIIQALEVLGRDDAETLGTSALSEMVGAMSLARVLSDAAEARSILRASREQIKEKLGL